MFCPKCGTSLEEGVTVCPSCGLEQQKAPIANKNNKRILIIAVAVIAIFAIGLVEKKIIDTRKGIENYENNKALEENPNTPTTSDLIINSDWKPEKRGNYIHIKGTVTNTSNSRTISYFEIEAKFYNNSGIVLDSEWTNDADDLAPGESRKFEIMHKFNSDEKDIQLSIREVK